VAIRAPGREARSRMVDRRGGLEITPVAAETVGGGAREAERRVAEPARRIPVLSPERKRSCVMIESEDGIQLRPGLAPVAISASQEEGTVRRVLRRGNSRQQQDWQNRSP
jgi:hypothetical protein